MHANAKERGSILPLPRLRRKRLFIVTDVTLRENRKEMLTHRQLFESGSGGGWLAYSRPVISTLRVAPGSRANLVDRSTDDTLGRADKEAGRAALADLQVRLRDLQTRLWAESSRSVLLVLQAMDCGGKDGTIRSVFTGVNPQGVRVVSFKVPSGREVIQDYLWRVHQQCPGHGEIGIFNRSHYEDVVAVRVHDLVPKDRWKRRYGHIRAFERLLVDEGTAVVKVFLHISADEQRRRLQARLTTPEKNWKFRLSDLADRERWKDFQTAYDDVLTETSTDWAPWYVVPADRKWVRNVAVSQLLVDTLERMDPRYPLPQPGIEQIVIP
jgi:PPK2 family polyphosphate:nucleotide phosphotransferase